MKTLYTVGYSRLHPADILCVAERLDALIADIRISPHSRLPVWNQKPLQAAWGRRYVYIPELGNRNYKGEAGAGVILADPERGTAHVLALLEQQSVILLCGCFDWQTCHRREAAVLIAQHTALTVIHLTHADVAPPAGDDNQQLPLFPE